jgi:molybdate transport system ATP-binding protein
LRQRAEAGFIRVRLEGVRLTLRGRPVLRGIDWDIRPGQRWVLLGANGAGKTQLLKLLAGDVWPSPGRGRRRYLYRGERFDDPYGIKQQIAYLGPERQDRYERYRWNARVEAVVGTGLHRTDIPLDALSATDRARVARLLRQLGLSVLTQRRFLDLSYGERRLVLLARALASAPKLLLLDELLSGLDPANRVRAQGCLAVLSRSALPWVLTSHRPEELLQVATHVRLLEHGRLTAVRKRPRAAGKRPSAGRIALRPRRQRPRQLLTLTKVTVYRAGSAVLRELSLTIARGECWVVHGPNGSGKSSCMQLLYGDLSAASGGSVRRAGLAPGVPIAQFKRRVGLVSPELQTLHPRELRVDEVIASGARASIGYDGRISKLRQSRVRRLLRQLGLRSLERRTLATLSYGQVRQILFARALLAEPDILLLDEPYAGLDAHTRASLRAVVDQALRSGVTVVMTSHHRDDWPGAVTHELQLRQGRPRYVGPVRLRHHTP